MTRQSGPFWKQKHPCCELTARLARADSFSIFEGSGKHIGESAGPGARSVGGSGKTGLAGALAGAFGARGAKSSKFAGYPCAAVGGGPFKPGPADERSIESPAGDYPRGVASTGEHCLAIPAASGPFGAGSRTG